MKENEPVRIRIQSRKQAGIPVHDLTITIKLTASDDEFWKLTGTYKQADPTAFLYSLYLFQTIIQQEKQGVLGKTIAEKRENNSSDKRPLQERNKQGLDREPITETGETYNAEQEYEALRKRTGEKETGQLSPLGLVGVNRRVLTDNGDLAFKAEAGA